MKRLYLKIILIASVIINIVLLAVMFFIQFDNIQEKNRQEIKNEIKNEMFSALNQSDKYSDLITCTYAVDKIEQLAQDIKKDTFDYIEFKNKFKIECVRKTLQGYYVVLLQDNNVPVFVQLSNDDYKPISIVRHPLKSKADYEEFVEVGKTTDDQLSEWDPNTGPGPTYGIYTTAHPVKDGGYFIIEYRSDPSTIPPYDPANPLAAITEPDTTLYYVKDINYISVDTLPEGYFSDFFYILEIDRL